MRDVDALLDEMDSYEWDDVKDYSHPGYEAAAPKRFKADIERYGLELNGSVLDVCSGPVSLASVYDDVVATDVDPSMVKNMREHGTRAIIADMRDLPFDPDSFDYVMSFWPPMAIYEDKAQGVEDFIEDLFTIARDKVIIQSTPMSRYLPEQFNDYLESSDGRMIVYDVAAYKQDMAAEEMLNDVYGMVA